LGGQTFPSSAAVKIFVAAALSSLTGLPPAVGSTTAAAAISSMRAPST